MTGGEAFWAYGVASGRWSPPQSLRGVDDRAVVAVTHDQLAVLASAVPANQFSSDALSHRLEDLDTLAALARAHDRVLHAALAETDVAPFRVCTLYASREAVEEMLRAKTDHFRSLLARLHDMTEWGVKAFLAAPAGVAPPTSGAEYLARRRAEREGTTVAESVAAEVHEALSSRAVASTLAPPQDRRISGRATEMILNGAYLLPRGETESFAAFVEEQDRRHGLELELTGPWPPYNFVAEAG
jgi:hypothetical protein